jgi:hypothetical protein
LKPKVDARRKGNIISAPKFTQRLAVWRTLHDLQLNVAARIVKALPRQLARRSDSKNDLHEPQNLQASERHVQRDHAGGTNRRAGIACVVGEHEIGHLLSDLRDFKRPATSEATPSRPGNLHAKRSCLEGEVTLTDGLFNGLVAAGKKAMSEEKWEDAEDLFLHARFVGLSLGKTSEELREARKGHRHAFFKLLEAGDK